MISKDELVEITYNTFDNLKHIDENGVEFWYGHDLAKALGYSKYGNFISAINRAKAAIAGRGINPDLHIKYCKESYVNGIGNTIYVDGCMVTRAGAYYIAMNGDTSKAEISAVQGYFVDNTNTVENIRRNMDDLEYIAVRENLKFLNKRMRGTLESHDVAENQIGLVLNNGYTGLFDMTKAQLMERNNIPANTNVPDVLGPELAAIKAGAVALSRIEIESNNVRGVNDTGKVVYKHHRDMRDKYIDAGGQKPEDAIPAENIKKVTSRQKSGVNNILDSTF